MVTVHVTKDVCGDVDLTAHVLAGRGDGPTLVLLSMLHGNEWLSVLVLRALLDSIPVEQLAGNVIAIPVANPCATLTGTRCILDNSDEPDANRAFGGEFAWLSNQITDVIASEFLAHADLLIDYHVGDWGCAMADVGYPGDCRDPVVGAKSRDMALAFGFPVIHVIRVNKGFPGPRSSVGYASETMGIPGIIPEIGGLGFGAEQEGRWVERNVEGTLSVMRALGMLPGTPTYCSKYLIVGDRWRVSPRVGGYLEPALGLEAQFSQVEKGQIMGKVISATTFEEVDVLRSPGRGIVFYMCRPYLVRPGGWAFGVASLENGSSYWAQPSGVRGF